MNALLSEIYCFPKAYIQKNERWHEINLPVKLKTIKEIMLNVERVREEPLLLHKLVRHET